MRKRFVIPVFVLFVLVVAACVPSDAPSKWTGGGSIPVGEDSGKATFGFNAHVLDPAVCESDCMDVKGQFQFNDHESDVKLHGVALEACKEDIVVDGQSKNRYIVTGTYAPQPKNLGAPGTFKLYVDDIGEPGLSSGDYFWLELNDGPFDGTNYEGELGGGNIQVSYE